LACIAVWPMVSWWCRPAVGCFLFFVYYNEAMIEFFKTIIYEPIYNILLFVTSYVPGADVGIAIIIVTLLIKFLLYPLSRKAIISQARLKKIEPQINEIKETYKDDKQQQAQATMELYKEHKINPLSGCLPTLLQLPIILSLFYVFRDFSLENLDIIYSFVSVPENISLTFLGILDLTSRSFLNILFSDILRPQNRLQQKQTIHLSRV
jgi:YidC/Oxa1 family membrane protein insertase